MTAMRVERDTLGERAIPADALYGIHTARALDNFALAGTPCSPRLIRGVALVKCACARTNAELGYLDPALADAILRAGRELAAGRWIESVCVDALQGGAGTSLNMNVNEVLANRAEELLGGKRGEYARVHPLHHVNLHQSTNDVVPTALKIAALEGLNALEKAVSALQVALQAKENAFAAILKVGRTQLQDAVPVSLGAAFGAWAEAIARDRWRISKCDERLRVVNLGATAVGTGISAPRDYIFRVVETLREETRLPLARADQLLDATQNADVYVEVSGIVKAHAVNLWKITSDLRLLASGPRAGIGEIRLPAVQVGSSVMPGKVNPVICEAAGQAALQAIANDQAVTLAAQSGQLELNAFVPLIAHALLGSLALLERADTLLSERCIDGIEADRERCRALLEGAQVDVTALVPLIGYEAAARVARQARANGRSARDEALAQGLASAQALDRALSFEAMTALGYERGRGLGTAEE